MAQPTACGQKLHAEAQTLHGADMSHDPFEQREYPKWTVSAWQNLGGRRNQEDRLAVCPVLGGPDLAFFGIWDGTIDDFVADQVKGLVLPRILRSYHWASFQALCQDRRGPEDSSDDSVSARRKHLKACLREAVLETDQEVVQMCRDVQNHYSCCTGVMALVADGVLTVAHLGDSRATLGFLEEGFWNAESLTVAHKPNSPMERQRIEESGGVVQCFDGRRDELMRAFIRGGDYSERKARGEDPKQLNYSRAFGGKDLKPYGLSNQPDIKQVVLDGRYKVLVMASDGLWDVCSEDRAVSVAMDATEEDRDPAQVLVEFALTQHRINRTKADNVTVIVVLFK